MQPPRLSSCEEYKHNISTLMDDALTQQDEESLMQHTQSCSHCFSELQAQKQICSLVRSNIHFLAANPMSQEEGTSMASSIMARIAQQDKVMDDYRKHPANHLGRLNPSHNATQGNNNNSDNSTSHPKYEFLFNPRPLIITSAASLLLLVGSSTSMLYSFSSIQHESLNDGSLVIMVSDIDIEK